MKCNNMTTVGFSCGGVDNYSCTVPKRYTVCTALCSVARRIADSLSQNRRIYNSLQVSMLYPILTMLNIRDLYWNSDCLLGHPSASFASSLCFLVTADILNIVDAFQ